MLIRAYSPEDAEATAQLFRETIREVCKDDYTPGQLRAWVSGCDDLDAWSASLLANGALVAEEDGRIVGFGDIDETGYLDRLFVHKDHQGEGVGAALCDALEALAPGSVSTYASITARPFFETRGYMIVCENIVARDGERLVNYLMKKLPRAQ
ncbi:MAG: GNAT family N-acetyltransferase [Eggerthellaceae bacterium]|nr:GNAT family N-acetyltransferase [Eggerthellaceae bacterium]